MTSPTFSPDGQWMWNGNEWIPAPPTSKTCTRCSRPIDDDWKTCPYCTYNLKTKTNTYQSNSIPKNQNISKINPNKNNVNIALIGGILIVCLILFNGRGILNISLYDWLSADCNAWAQDIFDDSFDQGAYKECQSLKSQAGFFLVLLAVLVLVLGTRLLSNDDKKRHQKSNSRQQLDLFGKPITKDMELRVSNNESKISTTDWKEVFDEFCNLVKNKSPQYYDQERYNKLEQIIQNYHWGNATESDDRTDLFFTTVYHVNQILELAPPSFQTDFENSQYYSKYQSVLSNAKALSLKQKSAYIVLIKRIINM